MELAARIGTMAQRGAPLPYDAEVEYLESTMTQFIKLGVVPNFNTETYIRFFITRFVPNTQVLGSRTGAAYYELQFDSSPTSIYFQFGNLTPLSNFDNTVESEWSIIGGRLIDLKTERIIADCSSTPYFQLQHELYLFALNINNEAQRFISARVYDLRVGDLNFKPVRFTNENGVSEGAMYDRASGQLFRNAGTGAFIIGPDVVSSRGGY